MRTLLTAVLCVFAFQTADQSQSTPAQRIVLPGEIKWQDNGGGFFGATSWAIPTILGYTSS